METFYRSKFSRATGVRLKIFGSPDLTVFLSDLNIKKKNLLSDGDSIYTRGNVYELLGIPLKTCLICTGTPVDSCRNF